MATVAEFTSPADAFPLGSVFETLPAVTVELERLVPREALVIPYFWVRGAAAADIEAAFGDDAGVENVRLVDSVEDEYLMRAAWDREHVGVLSGLTATDLAILSGVGTAEGWHFEVRGEDRDQISDFRAYCQREDIDIDITTVHALTPVQNTGYGLTDAQREALVLAFEMGYFDSPRTTDLADIAAELGITQQSLSSRLRRGHRRLVAATLVHERG
jgi:predicted DNA binding protein